MSAYGQPPPPSDCGRGRSLWMIPFGREKFASMTFREPAKVPRTSSNLVLETITRTFPFVKSVT